MLQYLSFFIHRDIHQEKVTCETNTFDWFCPGMSSHAQACLDISGVPLRSFGGISRNKTILI